MQPYYKMNKTLHFLSGVPRSGSTVLAAILNQNPMTHVSTTSGLGAALDSLATSWHQHNLLGDNDPDRKKLAHTMRGVIDAFYDTTDKPVVIDKARNWPIPVIMQAMAQVLGHKPKIIATVRSIPDCMASFVRVAKPENMDEFLTNGSLAKHLKGSYVTLQQGYEYDKESFLFVEYEDLIANPKAEIDRIHAFLDLPAFDYDYNNIDGSTVKEDDENLHGYSGLHDIKPVLERQHNDSSKEILKHYYSSFCQPEFWLDKPRTLPELHDLDLQLAAGRMGNFEEGWRLAQKMEEEEPWNNRAAFNRGWYQMWRGNLLEGEKLLYRGRIEGVFGNPVPTSPMTIWDGKSQGIVMLNLEGGLGDQIHGIRYVKYIVDRGCKVIVACSGQLAGIFRNIEGVTAVVQHEALFGVVHDFWLPSMSAAMVLGLEYTDISGKAYISRPDVPKSTKFRIGLRWQGNPHFEHEQYRLFPSELLFDAVKGVDAEVISLQRDEGAQHRPDWVKEVPLDHWEQTAESIASCDLVITSCTAVAHLSAAMGVATWIVVPVLPYYLWAPPANTTVWYDSVTLFRQTVFGDWRSPFINISAKLNDLKKQSA